MAARQKHSGMTFRKKNPTFYKVSGSEEDINLIWNVGQFSCHRGTSLQKTPDIYLSGVCKTSF